MMRRVFLLAFGAACTSCTALLGIDKEYRAAPDAAADLLQEGADGSSDALSNPNGIVKVTAGRFHSCALFASGTAKCWGRNDDYGELGDGTYVSSAVPVAAMGTGIVDLFAGAHDTCAALAGRGVCAGRGFSGELGNGGDAGSSLPVAMSELPAAPIAIASGEGFACALMSGGDVYCMGGGARGELGDGSFGTSIVAVRAQLGGKAKAIAAFGSHACALMEDGRVACWGDNSSGQLGNGNAAPDAGIAVPAPVIGIAGATAIGVGTGFSCALIGSDANNSSVWCWGANDRGQLGDGSTTQRSTPVQVKELTGAGSLAVGDMHACAGMLISGGIKCWGHGGSGQLGNGGSGDAVTPVDVSGIGGYPVSLTAGGFHTCALLASPVVECWGSNDFGQIGDGTTNQQSAPVQVGW
jgi:alpha-tubulin suppressor-like RCC1 family protein